MVDNVSASARIRELVSGYPSRLWSEKLLVVMQAFVDDSAWDYGDRRYFLCGYINTAERWIEFSENWDRVLKEPPEISYFHAVEAQNLRGEFSGWSNAARVRKVVQLAKVIQDSNPWGFSTWFNRSALDGEHLNSVPRVLQHPFQVAFWGAIYATAGLHEQAGMELPVDFIFDEQMGQEVLTIALLDWIGQEDPRIKKVVGSSPIFRNDKDFMPLQAADMLAWHIRRNAEVIDPPNSRTAFNLLRKDGRFIELPIPDQEMRHQAAQMAAFPFRDLVSTKSEAAKFKKEVAVIHAAGLKPAPIEHVLKEIGLRPDGEPKFLTKIKWRLFGVPGWARQLFKRYR